MTPKKEYLDREVYGEQEYGERLHCMRQVIVLKDISTNDSRVVSTITNICG